MTEEQRDALERALEQLDAAKLIVEEFSRVELVRTPLEMAEAGLAQATREVWRALQRPGRQQPRQ